jgi:cytochrome c oxidase assembly factor CtaG
MIGLIYNPEGRKGEGREMIVAKSYHPYIGDPTVNSFNRLKITWIYDVPTNYDHSFFKHILDLFI